jgi:hypothetical protein
VKVAPSVGIPQGNAAIPFTTAEKLRLSIEIVVTYFRVRWLMLRLQLPETVERLRLQTNPSRGSEELPVGGGWRYALAVIKTLRILPMDSRCLVRSLVLLRVLANRGIESTLVIGVRTKPKFGAHAWIERDGVPFLEPGDTDRGRLVEL